MSYYEGAELSSDDETPWHFLIDIHVRRGNSTGLRCHKKNQETSLSGSSSRRSHGRPNPLKPSYFYDDPTGKLCQSHKLKANEAIECLPYCKHYKSQVSKNVSRKSKRRRRNQKNILQDYDQNWQKKVIVREQCGHYRDHRELKDHYTKIERSTALSSFIWRDIKGSINNGYHKPEIAPKITETQLDTYCTGNLLYGATEYEDKQILNSHWDMMTSSHSKINGWNLKKNQDKSLLLSDEPKSIRETSPNQNSNKTPRMLSTNRINRKKYRRQKMRKKQFHFPSHPHFPTQSKVIDASRVPNEEESVDDSFEFRNPNPNSYSGDMKISQQDKQSEYSKIMKVQNCRTLPDGQSEILDIGDVSVCDKATKRYVLPNWNAPAMGRDCFNSLSGSASDLGSWEKPEWWYGLCTQPEKISKSSGKEMRDDDENKEYSQKIVLDESLLKNQSNSAPDDHKESSIMLGKKLILVEMKPSRARLPPT